MARDTYSSLDVHPALGQLTLACLIVGAALATAPAARSQHRYTAVPLVEGTLGPLVEDAAGVIYLGVGSSLWATDNTAAGTREVASFDRLVYDLTPAGDAGLVVTVDKDGDTWALWASDGSEAGTSAIAADAHGTAIAFQGAVLFWTQEAVGGPVTLNRYTADAGVEPLKTFAVAPDDGTGVQGPVVAPIIVAGDRACFLQPYLDAALGAADSVWSVDTAGTVELVGIYAPGSVTLAPQQRSQSRAVFTAWTHEEAAAAAPEQPAAALYSALGADATRIGKLHGDVAGLALLSTGPAGDIWRTDGTAEGTQLGAAAAISAATAEPDFPGLAFGGWRYWRTTKSLWRFDGATLELVANPKGAISDQAGGVGVWAGSERIWWYALQGGNEPELYVSDGTTAGTQHALGTAELLDLGVKLKVHHAAGAVLYGMLAGTVVAIVDTGEPHPCPDPALDLGPPRTVDAGEPFTLTVESCHPTGAAYTLHWGVDPDAPGQPVFTNPTDDAVDVTVPAAGEYVFTATADALGVEGLEVSVEITALAPEPAAVAEDVVGGGTQGADTSAGGASASGGCRAAGPNDLLGLLACLLFLAWVRRRAPSPNVTGR